MKFLSFALFASILNIFLIKVRGIPSRSPSGQGQLPSHVIHQFPIGTWVENIRVRHNGQILVTIFTSPDVYLIDPLASTLNPTSDVTAQRVHSFIPETSVLGITQVQPDQFYTIVGNLSLSDLGNADLAVWCLDLQNYDLVGNKGATVKEIAAFPTGVLLNGMDTLDASIGLLVIADSANGLVWLLNVKTEEKSIFLKEPEMAGPANVNDGLGINGLKVLQKEATAYIYFSTQVTALFCRIIVSTSTLQKTGPVEVLHNGTVVDDFALDEERGVAFLAGANLDALLSIPLEGGGVSTLAGGINDTLLAEPTSAALAGALAQNSVYVTTHGETGPGGNFTTGGKVVAVDVKGWTW